MTMSRRNTDAITIHSILGWIEDNLEYIRSRKLTEIAQKLKESNEPILYLAERYGFESQQTLTRTFKNYFDVPPHKYRITNMRGESRYLLPINHCNC